MGSGSFMLATTIAKVTQTGHSNWSLKANSFEKEKYEKV
jgi:hypothetical protein